MGERQVYCGEPSGGREAEGKGKGSRRKMGTEGEKRYRGGGIFSRVCLGQAANCQMSSPQPVLLILSVQRKKLNLHGVEIKTRIIQEFQ